jgi:polyisoprenoid-binding protein YceI
MKENTMKKITNETKWSIDPAHSEIAFKVRHLAITNVNGKFKTFDAAIHTTAKDFTTAEVDLWIDASSVSTADAKRDEHLKSADFLDVQEYKQITFVLNTIEKPERNGNFGIWGELTIKGISKNIKLNGEFGGIMKDPLGNEKAGFTLTGKINRSDWGLVWNTMIEGGGLMVGEEVTISCEIELINQGQSGMTMLLDTKDAEKLKHNHSDALVM